MRVPLGLLAIAAAVLATLAWSSSLHAQEGDPEAVVQAFADAMNDGDLDAAMAYLAEDVVVTLSDSTQSQAAYGKPAVGAALGGALEVNQQVDIIDISSEGNVVDAVAEVRDDEAEDAGIERVIQLITMTLNDDGLISSAEFTHDETDPETVEYLEFFFNPDATKPPPDVPSFAMNEQSGSGQTGVAAMVADPESGLTLIPIDISPGAEGVFQPAHLHTGTCESPGPVVQPLASPIGGASFTVLSVSPPLAAGAGLVLNVHKSAAESNVYVSCGVIEAVAPPAAPTAAAPTATPGTGVAAPDTGGGSPASSDASLWLLALIAAGAAVMLAGVSRVVFRRG